MRLDEFRSAIAHNIDTTVAVCLPDGSRLPSHFHVTEVGKVHKSFVDCGGTRREQVTCALQTFVADDVDHRIDGSTLKAILDASEVLGLDAETPVEVEVQQESISVFPVAEVRREGDVLEIALATKSTACLAPDKCGIDVVQLNLAEQ